MKSTNTYNARAQLLFSIFFVVVAVEVASEPACSSSPSDILF